MGFAWISLFGGIPPVFFQRVRKALILFKLGKKSKHRVWMLLERLDLQARVGANVINIVVIFVIRMLNVMVS
jgi:hypothetical protein